MRPSPRRVAPLLAIALLFTIAAPATARDPQMDVAIVGSKPIEVSAGQVVGYPVTVASVANKQTLTHVTAEAVVPGATYVGALTTRGSCEATVPFCRLGKFKPGTSAFVVFMFRASSDVSVTELAAMVTVHTGEGRKDTPNSAHADTFTADATTLVHHGGATTFFSRYVLPRSFAPAEDGVVETDQAITEANPHSTRVIVPDESLTEFGTPVTVREELVPPNAECRGQPCFGETSFISAADGSIFEEGVIVQVTFGAQEIPYWVDASSLHIIHNLDDGSYESVDTPCGGEPVAPCRISTIAQEDGSIVATMFLDRNGNIKGY